MRKKLHTIHTAKRKALWTAKRADFPLGEGVSQGGGCDSAQEGFSFGEEASLMGHWMGGRSSLDTLGKGELDPPCRLWDGGKFSWV